MTTTPVRVVCAGIATLDFVYGLDAIPTVPLKFRTHRMELSGGGLAGNAATACARLGAKVTLVARLGDDPFAGMIMDEFTREGIDVSAIRRCPGHRTPVSAVIIDDAGERMVVSYSDPDLPTDPGLVPEGVERGAHAIYAETRWIEAALDLLPRACAIGIPSVLDADRRPTRPEVLTLASHVGFSAQALRDWTGIDDLAAALAHAARGAGNILAVTDGARGCWFMDKDRVVHVPAFPVRAVDTLGAGDTWHGALAVALGEGQPLSRAMLFANAAAALKCTEFGGRKGMPRRDRVDALLAGA
ncbi:PfkB family carbohydrate kinase [Phreatobacter sp.]|uniref:PfkB family carbohydrate kinase n=1 Tax=Phreatobacter sp. TaxID=1966341 RepID=UPI0022C4F929|nr:PfkB family carbohydrate kinase [Phreatobacter sp.]MCZ8314771.1 PfkB family carbohydrate kinase [Phreatobacter sp.]